MIQGSCPLSDRERRFRVRLARSENVGPILFAQLLARYGSAFDAIEALPELARRGGRPHPLKVCTDDEAEREIDALERHGARFIVRGDANYPTALAAIDDPPPVLSVIGEAALLSAATVAIVGARNASVNGRKFAARLAEELGTAGVVVVSGLARGIDSAAHEGSLATGTIAVVAGGLDVVYPKENEALFREIAARGSAVAENPLGIVPTARHFPRRNRIISGLSLGVVIVEAAMRSGSLITARMAAEQGRQVFAVPGSPLDPRTKGTNNLIRQGATLIDSVVDVLEVLGQMTRAPSHPVPASEDEVAVAAENEAGETDLAAIVETIGHSPVAVDEIIRHCGLSPSTVAMAVLELELAGRVDRHPGNKVALSG
jgi:DNA processing protein